MPERECDRSDVSRSDDWSTAAVVKRLVDHFRGQGFDNQQVVDLVRIASVDMGGVRLCGGCASSSSGDESDVVGATGGSVCTSVKSRRSVRREEYMRKCLEQSSVSGYGYLVFVKVPRRLKIAKMFGPSPTFKVLLSIRGVDVSLERLRQCVLKPSYRGAYDVVLGGDGAGDISLEDAFRSALSIYPGEGTSLRALLGYRYERFPLSVSVPLGAVISPVDDPTCGFDTSEDGYCYLLLFPKAIRGQVAISLGINPRLEEVCNHADVVGRKENLSGLWLSVHGSRDSVHVIEGLTGQVRAADVVGAAELCLSETGDLDSFVYEQVVDGKWITITRDTVVGSKPSLDMEGEKSWSEWFADTVGRALYPDLIGGEGDGYWSERVYYPVTQSSDLVQLVQQHHKNAEMKGDWPLVHKIYDEDVGLALLEGEQCSYWLMFRGLGPGSEELNVFAVMPFSKGFGKTGVFEMMFAWGCGALWRPSGDLFISKRDVEPPDRLPFVYSHVHPTSRYHCRCFDGEKEESGLRKKFESYMRVVKMPL